MSLSEKWEEYRNKFSARWKLLKNSALEDSLQRAFYAGAEAVQQSRTDTMGAYWEFQAEIDRFKGLK